LEKIVARITHVVEEEWEKGFEDRLMRREKHEKE